MKKIISILTITVFFAACSKKDKISTPSLIGKWAVVNYSEKEWDNGVMYNDYNYIGKPSDYMEFRNDNTVSFYMDGFGLILDYHLQPDNKVNIDGETYTIQVLTSSNATLYLKYNYSPDEYDETTITLKR